MSSMRSTNSSLIAGTHHIFFPPRLEAMVRECDPGSLPPQLRCDSSCDRLRRHEAHRPACSPRGWWAAYHRDDCGLLSAVQHRVWLGTRVVAQGVLEPTGEIPLADARRLATVGAKRLRGRAHRVTQVQQQQGPNTSP